VHHLGSIVDNAHLVMYIQDGGLPWWPGTK